MSGDYEWVGGSPGPLERIAGGIVALAVALAMANWFFWQRSLFGFEPKQVVAGLTLLALPYAAYAARRVRRR